MNIRDLREQRRRLIERVAKGGVGVIEARRRLKIVTTTLMAAELAQ